MKKCIALLLVITSLLAAGCAREEKPDIRQPITFYYPRQTLVYNASDGVIRGEVRDMEGIDGGVEFMLNMYLSGPITPELKTPFPEHARLVSIVITDTNATLTVTRPFSTLTGLDLTVACACLTMTTISLTGVETVTIQADSALLDSAKQITMDKDCFLLLDDNTLATAKED